MLILEKDPVPVQKRRADLPPQLAAIIDRSRVNAVHAGGRKKLPLALLATLSTRAFTLNCGVPPAGATVFPLG